MAKRRYRSRKKSKVSLTGTLIDLLGQIVIWPITFVSRKIGYYLFRWMSPSVGTKSVTKRGETVKSIMEKRVADWFYDHQIEYEYEKPVKVWFFTKVYPDFYLPKLNCYVEYYGLLGHPTLGRRYKEQKAFKERHYARLGLRVYSFDKRHNNIESALSKTFLKR